MIQTYLDGYANIYEDVEKRSTFGAKENEGNTVLKASKVPFAEMSQRQADIEFANQMNFDLSRKIRIQYCTLLKRAKKYKVVIDGAMYDVSYFDVTRDSAFLYLQYIREVTSN